VAEKMYLYLGRRDKKGLKLVTVLSGPVTPMTRLPDVGVLNLPLDMAREITDLIHQDRMMYEPWVETAGSYQELKKRLEERGYSDLPIHTSPLYRDTSLSRPQAATPPQARNRTMVQKPKVTG
jgi:hypothetical protein